MISFFQNFISYLREAGRGFRELRHFRLSSLGKVFSFLGTKERITLAILALIAATNLLLILRNFYVNHTVIAPAYGGLYTEGLLGQPTYLNPLLAHESTDLALTRLIFSGLYKYDNTGRVVPDLADGMPLISDDQKQYTINLRHNVKWHNDKPFTADDVVFTIQTLKDPAYKSPLRSAWNLASVEKLSDYQVRFTTTEISGPFLQSLTLPIRPRSVWSNVSPQNFLLNESNLRPVGTGPYSMRELRKLKSGKVEQITLDSFSNYYGGKPKIDTVVIRFYDTSDDLLNALHSREISGLGFVSADQQIYLDENRSDVQVLKLPLPQYQVLFFNLNNKILSDPNVRKALNSGIDKQAIVHDVFKDAVLLPASPLKPQPASPEPVVYNPDTARALLDAAGWKVDQKTNLRTKKNSVFELTLATNDSLPNSQAAEAVASQWRNLNVKINLNVLTTKDLTDNHIRPRNFDVVLFPQKFTSDPDPFVFWHSSQIHDPGSNISGFSDPAADKLLTAARTTTDQIVRQQKYQQFDQMLADKLPVIFLDQSQYIYAVDSQIKNIGLKVISDPSLRFLDLPNWYMEEKRNWK